MDAGRITEAEFLLIELQYTLGQLHVQLDDLDAGTRAGGMSGDRSIDAIVREMSASERKYQSQYARLLPLHPSPDETDDNTPPLTDNAEDLGALTRFEHQRSRSIALLRGTESAWSQEMLELVRQQIANDRTHTTQIAELRGIRFQHNSRPDLDEPLTTRPHPHGLAGEMGSHLEAGEEHTSLPHSQ